MKTIFYILLMFCSFCFAEIPISTLPSYTGSQVGSTDIVPFVHFGSPNVTGQLPISNLYSVPSLATPSFVGPLTAPSGTFANGIRVGVATLGTTPVQHNLNTVSAASANCGSVSGAFACIKININGTVHYIPYF
jgi:hypothetical protein